MADDAEDVLVLDTELEIEDDPDEQTDGDVGEAGEEDAIGFTDEEAAPASEGDSSVINTLRTRERELAKSNKVLARKVAEYERTFRPQIVDPGPEPELDENYEWDQEKWKVAWVQWSDRKAKAEQTKQTQTERENAQARKNQERANAFEASKSSLRVSDYDDAEALVAETLHEDVLAAVLRKGNPALLYAIGKSPTKLTTLSSFDPSTEMPEVLFYLGELGANLKVETRKAPSPERKVTGNTGFTPGTDKQLARLEKDAEQTGDRTALIAFRRKLEA